MPNRVPWQSEQPNNVQRPSMKKHVNKEIQVFKALCMIFILVGHLEETGFRGPFDLFPIYGFHVAAFVFVSGYLYRDIHDAEPLRYVVSKARSLLVPTLLVNVLYGVLCAVLHTQGFMWGSDLSFESLVIRPFTNGHQFSLNYTMWFVPTLFFAETCFVLIRNLLSRVVPRPAVECLVSSLCIIAGCASVTIGGASGLQEGIELLLCRTGFFLSFLALGRLYRLYAEPRMPESNGVVLCVALSLQLAITVYCKGATFYYPSWARFPRNFVIEYAISLTSIVFWLHACKAVTKAIGDSKTVSAVANNTFPIMLHHRLAFFVISYCMGCISSVTPLFHTFDWTRFHNQSVYYFLPFDLGQFYIVYLMAGIAIPLAIHFAWKAIYTPIRTRLRLACDTRG